MTEVQLYDLLKTAIQQLPVVGLLCWLYLQERQERIKETGKKEEAEKRERALLRELADCKPEPS